jgi:hypothetical protein
LTGSTAVVAIIYVFPLLFFLKLRKHVLEGGSQQESSPTSDGEDRESMGDFSSPESSSNLVRHSLEDNPLQLQKTWRHFISLTARGVVIVIVIVIVCMAEAAVAGRRL